MFSCRVRVAGTLLGLLSREKKAEFLLSVLSEDSGGRDHIFVFGSGMAQRLDGTQSAGVCGRPSRLGPNSLQGKAYSGAREQCLQLF